MIAGAPNTGMNGQFGTGSWSNCVGHQCRSRVPLSMPLTIVPMPASVNTSSSSTCSIRPSRMCARRTPLRTACVQLATFGIIPPAIVPSAIERVEFVGGRLADQAARVVDVAPQPLDVGEIDELLGAERLGDRSGHGVGVDVVRLAGDVAADRGDHRDELVVDQAEDHLRVDLGDVADEAEFRVAGDRPDQPGVDAADRRRRTGRGR